MEGFIVIDYAEQFPNAIMELAGWVAEGKLLIKKILLKDWKTAGNTS